MTAAPSLQITSSWEAAPPEHMEAPSFTLERSAAGGGETSLHFEPLPGIPPA